MKIIGIRRLGLRVVSLGLTVVIFTTYSMVALAGSANPAGELTVTGGSPSDTAAVTVNGEPAKTGRTVFSPSTITTPDTSGAVINLGKAGKIELAPKTTFTLTTEADTIGGSLSAGSLTVLNSAKTVNVKTLSGELVKLNAGETATATSAAANKAKPGPGGLDWWYWAAIIGGAAAVIIIVAATTGDEASPVR